MSKKEKKHNLGRILICTCIVLALISTIILVLVWTITAGNRMQDSNNVGIGAVKFPADTQVGVLANTEFENPENFESANTALATYSTRDITTALSAISFQIEMAAKAAAEAARAEELIQANMAKNRRNDHARKYAMPAGLTEVNWDVGKEAFFAEWTQRIDNYLARSPLYGMGAVFTEAAWDCGMDPRWSPAISNTESSKGLNCFAPHNAWGWGGSGWGSWPEAIHAHVNGLAQGYGYTITPWAAEKYCPPNSENWYNNTLSEMRKI